MNVEPGSGKLGMKNGFDIEQYLSDGVETLVKGAVKASRKNPKNSGVLLREHTGGCTLFEFDYRRELNDVLEAEFISQISSKK